MFAIIIAVVAIVLTVVITLATHYYGGDLSSEANQEADVAKALNELSQIRGAVVTYTSFTGQPPESISELVPDYLATLPSGWGIDQNPLAFEAKQVLGGGTVVAKSTCEKVNDRLGLTGEPPQCNDLEKGFYGCCVLDAVDEAQPDPVP